MYTDPDDEEYEDISKNERKIGSMADAMSCKRSMSSRVTGAVNMTKAQPSEKIQKTKFDGIVAAHESTRPRMESVTKTNHEDHIAGKGQNSLSHYELVHKFIPVPQVM